MDDNKIEKKDNKGLTRFSNFMVAIGLIMFLGGILLLMKKYLNTIGFLIAGGILLMIIGAFISPEEPKDNSHY